MKASSAPFLWSANPFSVLVNVLLLTLSLSLNASSASANTEDIDNSFYGYLFDTNEDGCNVYTELHKDFNCWGCTEVAKVGVPLSADLILSGLYGAINPSVHGMGKAIFLFSLQNILRLNSVISLYGEKFFAPDAAPDDLQPSLNSMVSGTMFALNMASELIPEQRYRAAPVNLNMNDRYSIGFKSIGVTSPLSDAIKQKQSKLLREHLGMLPDKADALSTTLTASYYIGTVVIGAKTGLFRAGYLDSAGLRDGDIVDGLTKLTAYSRDKIAQAATISAAYKVQTATTELCVLNFDTLFPTVHYTRKEKEHFCTGASSAIVSISAAIGIQLSTPGTFRAVLFSNLAEAGGLFLTEYGIQWGRGFSKHPLLSDAGGMAAGGTITVTTANANAHLQIASGPFVTNFVHGSALIMIYEGTNVVISHSYPMAALAFGDFLLGKKGGLSEQYCKKREK